MKLARKKVSPVDDENIEELSGTLYSSVYYITNFGKKDTSEILGNLGGGDWKGTMNKTEEISY